jgi:hypothetical protein
VLVLWTYALASMTMDSYSSDGQGEILSETATRLER